MLACAEPHTLRKTNRYLGAIKAKSRIRKMKTIRKNEFTHQPNPLVRFARGVVRLYDDYHELNAEARRRYPDAFR